jgi:hypothetical protein
MLAEYVEQMPLGSKMIVGLVSLDLYPILNEKSYYLYPYK